MKKQILLYLVLISAFSCYIDNGEPLRRTYRETEFSNPPCIGDLILNSVHSNIYSREYFTFVNGLTPGKYLSGYFVYANISSTDYYYRIEFLNKPIGKKIYTTTTTNNNSSEECMMYATHKVTNEDLFAVDSKSVYVDTLTNGNIRISFCDIQFKHLIGSNSIYINNFSVSSPN